MNFSNVEQIWGNGHILACVADTGSGISLICNGSIVERTKDFKLIGILCVTVINSRVLSEQTMLGSCEACPLTSKDIEES